MKWLASLVFLITSLHATFSPSHEEGDFVPWYTGSLLSTPGENMPVGSYNVQPYLNVTTNYGAYDDNFRIVGIQNLTQINPLFLFQTGITNFMDTQILIQSFHSTRGGVWSHNLGDTQVTLGFQLYRTSYGNPVPTLRFTVLETFPTGKYQNLQEENLRTDSTGAGSFQTQLGINSEKIYYPSPEHPIRLRLNLLFTIPSKVHIKGLNTYGGDPNTNGKLFPGYQISGIISSEISITQRWVFATDIVYIHRFQGKFSGQAGSSPEGLTPQLSTQSGDILTMTPSIEYNFSKNFGVIGGCWLSIFGRNNAAFYSGVFSAVYTF